MKSGIKIILFILVIFLIGAGITIMLDNSKDNENNNKTEISQSNSVKNSINWISEEISNSTQTQKETNVQNSIEENINKEEQEDSKQETTPLNNDEKALNIAKEDWGEDPNVTFKIDEKSEDGKYIISVVDKSTTQVLIWYEIDVIKNTIKEK